MLFFASFCWLWDFLLESLKSKKPLCWCPLEGVENIKMLPEIILTIFSRKELQYKILNHLYFGPNFVFCRELLQGVLASDIFLNFSSSGQPSWPTFLLSMRNNLKEIIGIIFFKTWIVIWMSFKSFDNVFAIEITSILCSSYVYCC